VRRVLLDSVKRVMNGQPPIGVGTDLSGVRARDGEVEEGAKWQDLVPTNRPAVTA
jgi:phthalate 4,5-dioxygenase